VKVSTAVRRYIAHKRKMGWSFSTLETLFRSFSSHVGCIHLSAITSSQVAFFLEGPRTSNSTWHQKYEVLARFFRFWKLRGQLERLPMPPMRTRTPHTFVPYIYSREEIRRLVSESTLNETTRLREIDALTFRCLLIFLYGTGVRVGEALTIREDKVDLKKDVITIEGHGHSRMRVIPIGPDIHKVLKTYLSSPTRRQFHGGNLFLTRTGRPLNRSTLSYNFQELRRRAGLMRLDRACYQPRMHDLRSTFAVHRITAWYHEGRSPVELLPALSAYLGQSGFVSINRHLALTPEHYRQHVVSGKLDKNRRRVA
jgi:integrase/recombinase XerD